MMRHAILFLFRPIFHDPEIINFHLELEAYEPFWYLE